MAAQLHFSVCIFHSACSLGLSYSSGTRHWYVQQHIERTVASLGIPGSKLGQEFRANDLVRSACIATIVVCRRVYATRPCRRVIDLAVALGSTAASRCWNEACADKDLVKIIRSKGTRNLNLIS